MFSLKNFSAFYGASQVLQDVSFDVRAGEVLCILGRNGAGKTSMLRGIMNLMPSRSGTIQINDDDISNLPRL